jgi:Cof subfamily protein (haloacid dehalogenase superfamily)
MIDKKLLKSIKLIVSDVDGTLLKNDGSLGEETKKLVKQLMQHDVKVCLATGRLHSAVIELTEQLVLNGPVISLDGSLIKYQSNGKALYESFIKENHVKKALKYAEELLVNIVLCHDDAIYYTDHNSIIPGLLNKYGAAYKKIESYNDYFTGTLEIICASDMKKSIKFLTDKFSFPHSTGSNASFFQSRSHENIYYLEIRKAGSTKGKGLKRVLKHYGFKISQSAVIGDWYNDITMFHPKAIKVAVANAIPELIGMADVVTERTNNDEGAAEFFEMVLKAKKDRV